MLVAPQNFRWDVSEGAGVVGVAVDALGDAGDAEIDDLDAGLAKEVSREGGVVP